MRFRLRTLFMLFFVAAVALTAFASYVRWANSRPGKEFAGFVTEIADIKRELGDESVQELKIWNMYSEDFFNGRYLWTAKVPPAAIDCLKKTLRLKPISMKQMPPEFWDMPPTESAIPVWWKPKPTVTAEYFQSRVFFPGGASNDSLDGTVMYDPQTQRVHVWSQFDF